MELFTKKKMDVLMKSTSNGITEMQNSSKPKVPTSISSKIFCDPVHGQIALHPVCVAIVDTPEFQRLRNIKQTGCLEYVYPGATHNRFNHSLGVYYLAGKFAQELRERQPELPITNIDILCIQIAGLCHDLGHGPFSHSWERFMNMVSAKKKNGIIWKHEAVSINLIDYLIEENDLYPLLKSYGIGPKQINLVKDFILGAKPEEPHKAFLYQIVNNDDSGLDVDKWDYFLRDCHYLGVPCNFEYERLIQFAKVLLVDGKFQICFRDKVLESVHNVFRTRSTLHHMAYQHKVIITIERMLIDALYTADDKCVGPSGEILQFYDWSMAAAQTQGVELRSALRKFCMLTDCTVFSAMKFSLHTNVQKASHIIKAIERRSCKGQGFYKHIGMKILAHFLSDKEIHHGISLLLEAANESVNFNNMDPDKENKNLEMFYPVTTDDFHVVVVSINWGKRERNPADSVNFYSKHSVLVEQSKTYNEVSAFLPKSFEEIQAHVICCRNDMFAVQVMNLCFEKYFNSIQMNGNGYL